MTDTKPEFYAILTEAGKELQFECLNSDKEFIMSEIAVGDSNGSYYEPERTQTIIKNECYRHTITRTITDKAGQVKSVILDIPEDINGFTIREAGIYGKDGKLLIVAKYPATPLLNPESGAVIQQAIKIDIAQNNEIVLPVLIDPSINTASVEYVEKHFQKLDEKAQPNGYASLDENGLVPKEQLPVTDFVKGCVNSGLVDANGEPSILTYDETTRTITVNAPFVYTTHSGKTYECSENLTAVIDENVTGTVRFWVAKNADGAFFVEALVNNIYNQKSAPENPQENDVWVDTSIAPEKALRFVNGAWQIYEGVETGALTGLQVGGLA